MRAGDEKETGMMEPAIALVETNSVAAGILCGDTMVKKAVVQLLEARPICPGKYLVLRLHTREIFS